MGFSNIFFVFIFLPAVLFSYFAVCLTHNMKLKNGVMLLASLGFYAWCGVQYLILLLAMLILSYMGVLLMKKKKTKCVLALTISINVVVLVVFKYFNFFIQNLENLLSKITGTEYIVNAPIIPLPLGISFFVFQIISFIVDYYNGKIKLNSFTTFVLYIMLFPQLIEGPIVRYSDVEKQLYDRPVILDDVYIGIQRFIIGLAKKTLIADRLLGLSDTIFEIAKVGVPIGYAWLGVITYAFVIFFDFSGYTDMAIGLCRIFGFYVGENFNYPYIATSVQDFWRRWHISLTSWFRDYIYIPLGGNRNGKLKTYRNLAVVYLLTGIWHGANWTFLAWGMFHGFFQLIEKAGLKKVLDRIPKFFSRMYCWIVVLVGWVLFRADSIQYACAYVKAMFIPNGLSYAQLDILLLINRQIVFTMIIAAILSTPIVKILIECRNKWMKIVIDILLLGLFLITLSALVSASFSPSIYTKF